MIVFIFVSKMTPLPKLMPHLSNPNSILTLTPDLTEQLTRDNPPPGEKANYCAFSPSPTTYNTLVFLWGGYPFPPVTEG